MVAARPDVNYRVLALDDWIRDDPQRARRLLASIAQRLEAGELVPLARRVYPLCEARAALWAMQQAQHIGKIVLTLDHPRVRLDAAYLITGGLGALGLAACAWLLEQGAGQVVLTSRRAPDAAQREQIATLAAETGGQVQVHPADVGEAAEVEALVARFGTDWPALAGVIHAAGVLDDGPITEQDPERLSRVLRPKVSGAWHLHRATRDLTLDFFVLYGSIAAVLGSPGQAGYAAANAFLEALAQQRRAQGLVATTVAWGPWGEGGMASTEVVRARLARQGLTPLPPAAAHWALTALLGAGVAGGLVVDADWRRLARQWGGARPPLLVELLPAETAVAGDSPLLGQLREVPVAEREPLLVHHLQAELQRILGLGEPPDAAAGFFELGMDSLMAVELGNRLQQQLGDAYAVPNTLVFDYPTPQKLAAHLAEQLGVLTDPAPVRPRIQAGATHEAIAIVGLACRFPGAPDAAVYWELLANQVDAITEVPPERWDIEAYYDPDPDVPGKMSTRWGGFIEGIDLFDPDFFGISPREAVELDPQQRLLLELAWHALEDAGIAPQGLAGSRTGVYVGLSTHDYGQLLARGGEQAIGPYMGTGTAHSAAVGRISFVLGLEGPSFAVDTACSSSLVALTQAAKGLRDGDCDLALAGGVNAMLTPEPTIYFSKGRFMAPDGRCKSFDAAADSYVRGEGGGLLVLKRLSDAERDGDRILALVTGNAVNQDGASSGLTVPNGPSQERVIGEALARAGVAPAAIGYVEAHGTGTGLGDPIEVQSLHRAIGQAREHPLWIGSVKTNIGHLEAAAGVASVIKVVLAMRHGLIPGQLHFCTPSPRIPWDAVKVRVAAAPTPWPAGMKIAGVSGFAFQGTNAHVILEDYEPARAPRPEADGPVPEAREAHLLGLSAKSATALQVLAASYRAWLQAQPEASLADLCHTAGVGRSHFRYRVGIPVTSREQLLDLLGGLAAGDRRRPPRLALLFPGEAGAYAGMGTRLYATEPALRRTLDRCESLAQAEHGRSLLAVLFGEAADPWTPVALYALGAGLHDLCRALGLVPDLVLGEGVGEYVAAYAAANAFLDALARHEHRLGSLAGHRHGRGARRGPPPAPEKRGPHPAGCRSGDGGAARASRRGRARPLSSRGGLVGVPGAGPGGRRHGGPGPLWQCARPRSRLGRCLARATPRSASGSASGRVN
jgi:3-oxoacyl-(acyl-carrier-protein) synthase/NAD(P)-dependent dehydrogenase (short-subunit alcohol dehydrogenase family)/acyl carrier protein